ncbi:MAG: hypothetical protein ABW318_09945, partial [Vicinamibacterales bacterium]
MEGSCVVIVSRLSSRRSTRSRAGTDIGLHEYADRVRIHLVDGTYELFRHFYAMPSAKNHRGEE